MDKVLLVVEDRADKYLNWEYWHLWRDYVLPPDWKIAVVRRGRVRLIGSDARRPPKFTINCFGQSFYFLRDDLDPSSLVLVVLDIVNEMNASPHRSLAIQGPDIPARLSSERPEFEDASYRDSMSIASLLGEKFGDGVSRFRLLFASTKAPGARAALLELAGIGDAEKVSIEAPGENRKLGATDCGKIKRAVLELERTHVGFPLGTQPSDDDVLGLLSRVPEGMEHWTWEDTARSTKSHPTRWDVSLEYHVQSILFLMLKAVFPELLEEEELRATGHIKPIIDFLIPSMELGIEVKFIRSQEGFRSVVREIAQDAGLYLRSNSDCKRIIVFVWDDTRTIEKHVRLSKGLKEIDGVVGAIVMPRPGRMMKEPS